MASVIVKMCENLSNVPSLAYRNKKYSDLTIINGDKEYHVHKIILCSFIPYFDKMFSSGLKKSTSSQIKLDHPTELFDLIIDWAYCQPIWITKENALGLFHLSDYLDIPDLANESLSFLFDHFSNEVIVEIEHWINQTATPKARQLIDQYICSNFCDIVTTKIFLNYDVDTVHYIMSLDQLNIDNEVQVFKAIIKWISINTMERLEHLPKLILSLHWTSINIIQFTDIIAQNICIKLCKEIHPIIMSAFQYICFDSVDETKNIKLIIGPRHRKPKFLYYLTIEAEEKLTLKSSDNRDIQCSLVCDNNLTYSRCTNEILIQSQIGSDKLILINLTKKSYRWIHTDESVASRLFGRNFVFKRNGKVFLWKGDRAIESEPIPEHGERINSVAPYKGQFYVCSSVFSEIRIRRFDPCDNVWLDLTNLCLSSAYTGQLKHVVYDKKLILFFDDSKYQIHHLRSNKWTEHLFAGLWNKTSDLHFIVHLNCSS